MKLFLSHKLRLLILLTIVIIYPSCENDEIIFDIENPIIGKWQATHSGTPSNLTPIVDDDYKTFDNDSMYDYNYETRTVYSYKYRINNSTFIIEHTYDIGLSFEMEYYYSFSDDFNSLLTESKISTTLPAVKYKRLK